MSFFHDINLRAENCLLDRTRDFIVKVADFHQLEMQPGVSNKDYMQGKKQMFPDSKWTPRDY